MRIKDFAERLSSAMVLLQMSLLSAPGALRPCVAVTAMHPEYSIGAVRPDKGFMRVHSEILTRRCPEWA